MNEKRLILSDKEKDHFRNDIDHDYRDRMSDAEQNYIQEVLYGTKKKDTQPEPPRLNFSDFMLIGEASKFVGVSDETLRNWEKRKKLVSYRHPINSYRMYKKADLENLLKRISND